MQEMHESNINKAQVILSNVSPGKSMLSAIKLALKPNHYMYGKVFCSIKAFLVTLFRRAENVFNHLTGVGVGGAAMGAFS